MTLDVASASQARRTFPVIKSARNPLRVVKPHVLEPTPEAALLYLIRKSHKPTQQEGLQGIKLCNTHT
ncbi:hypothetical protein O3P69_002336 [Scylla paramamosain]|uniref:Uncharacterized protein n=1 Tax=Scylla paramamosain TaxID=85552 RepID=A0AAW0V6T8_SCYPA